MTISEYIHRIHDRYKTGISTEHSYRGDLQQLLETMLPDTVITNEPIRIKCGAPDYIITRRGIPIGYFEAKDMDADLLSKEYKEQFERYRASLPNLIITNYLDFHWYKDGELVTQVSLASIEGTRIIPNSAQYSLFTALIKDFASWTGQTITSSRKLAEMMASKAKLLATIITNVLDEDSKPDEEPSMVKEENITLFDQLHTFKEILIHNITHREFADIYSQTIAYGMFAARLHDPTLRDFTRVEAANLIPKTNPFLRKLFHYIAGYDLDSRITWIVDALADIFRATDVSKLLRDFGKATAKEDPMIHFYETFLAEYDSALRKSRGVWYTPEPVVNFIVRAVDEILKTEFGLKQGLADNSKTKIKVKAVNKKTADRKSKITEEEVEVGVHKVQILDPACGTGTFLAEVIKNIYNKFQSQKGIWSSYVENDLIPRLNGFELLMASYAMAHLKLDLLLSETGYNSGNDQRFKIFLTNSLEEYHPDTGTLFASWLSDEANQANRIKRDAPVMVVIGNPPYSISSSNKSIWITELIADYKKDLNEQNIQPLSNDYVKFIRFGEHFINKTGYGVLAYISSNSFINGNIHRRMRQHLLETFDKVFVLDLHGNANKKETTPDGSTDQNVFDIMEGVSINIFIKTGTNSKNATVFNFDLYGKREKKYEFLLENTLKTIQWNLLDCRDPHFFFTQMDFTGEHEYQKGFKIDELFPINSTGVKTHRDHLVIEFDRDDLEKKMCDFYSKDHDDNSIASKYNLKNNRDWNISNARRLSSFDSANIIPFDYRPFDTRFCYFSSSLIDFPRETVMLHLLRGKNMALVMPKQIPTQEESSSFITNHVSGHKLCSAYNINNIFPLYLYHETQEQKTFGNKLAKSANLDLDIVHGISLSVGLTYDPVKNESAYSNLKSNENNQDYFGPQDLFDYIHAILHSRQYRNRYKEFFKIDFPRIPYPKDPNVFWSLVAFGKQLRTIQLLENPIVEASTCSYPVSGTNKIIKLRYQPRLKDLESRLWINDSQYFEGVQETSWTTYIGGYQPAQRWLKDRAGRTLSHEDIFHYQKIIVALAETDRIMKEIDKISFE